MNEIQLNGEAFKCIIVSPDIVQNNPGFQKLYFFSGVTWKQLDRMPKFDALEQVQYDERRVYKTVPLPQAEPNVQLFWNNQWYGFRTLLS